MRPLVLLLAACFNMASSSNFHPSSTGHMARVAASPVTRLLLILLGRKFLYAIIADYEPKIYARNVRRSWMVNYCFTLDTSLTFLEKKQISSIFSRTAIALTAYLWREKNILMHRVMFEINPCNTGRSMTNTWTQPHWPKLSPEAMQKQLLPQIPSKVTAAHRMLI